MLKRLSSAFMALALILALAPSVCWAANANQTVFYLGSPVNAGLDTGYNEDNEITRQDPHFGWSLGRFAISGYTGIAETADGTPVFLKTQDDKISLSFELAQDIDAINGNEILTVNRDSDGYDQYFQIKQTDFGQGALIVRHTNYQNATGEPQIYTDYLSGIESGANTEVILLEEGDYEVRLDYELKNDVRHVGPVSLLPEYSNYKIDIRFQVRNGNSMVFPFDLATGSELTNQSLAPSGFYLDLARSRYLDINVKKEVMAAGANGLVEDTRFNGPARDGDQYTEEGIYTITAKNPSTGQETVKTIYVGSNPVLKAYAVTGLPIETINERLANGEVVAEDGNLVWPEDATIAEESANEDSGFPYLLVFVFVCALFAIAIAIALNMKKKRRPELPEGSKQIEAGPESKMLETGKEEER